MALLIEMTPLNPATGTRVTLRFADTDDDRITGLDGQRWFPGVVAAPALNREGWNGNWTGGVALPQAAFDMRLDALKAMDANAPLYRYAGASVFIHRGEAGDVFAEYETLFAGAILQTTIENGVVRVSAQVDSLPFEASTLENTYTGAGLAGGVLDLAEKAKPAVFGTALNVEPVLIDVVNNVYQVHGYGPIEAVTAVYERAMQFDPSVGDYASYAALVAADIAEGYWGTCLAEGMFRMGAPAYGLITADVQGDNTGGFHQSTTEVMLRLSEMCGVLSAQIDQDSMDAFEAEVPYPINLYLTVPETLIDVLERLARPCNAQVSFSWLGLFQVTRFGEIPAPSFVLDVQGRQMPPVAGAAEQAVGAPWWRIEMLASRNWRVHSADEIATLDANGITTTRYPDPPPENPPIGSIYWDINNEPYRYEGREFFAGSDQLFAGTDILMGSGWVSVRDTGLESIINDLQALDDDGKLTVIEKKIAIERDRQLLNIHNGVLQQAASLGYDAAAVVDARASYVALRDSLVPAWDDTSQQSDFGAVAWDATLDAYEEAIAQAQADMTALTGITVVPPTAQVVRVDSDEDPISGEFPRILVPLVKRGGVDITTSAEVSYAVAVTAGTLGVSVNNTTGPNKGEITFSSGIEGEFVLTVTVSDLVIGEYPIAVTTAYAQPWIGNAASGKKVFEDGFVLTWRDISFSGAVDSSQKFAYGDSHVYATFAKSWVAADDGVGDVSTYVTLSEVDGATMKKNTANVVVGTLFSWGF